MAGGGKHKLEYVKQQEPKFLRDFKARTNFKEGPTVDTKRRKIDEKLAASDDDGHEKEDEKPTICVINDGDLTEEDYEKYVKNRKEIKDNEPLSPDSKIMFKKPVEKTSEDSLKTSKASSKEKKKGKQEKSTKKAKKVDNKSLLSFDEEEDN